jgi:hypothetical protein
MRGGAVGTADARTLPTSDSLQCGDVPPIRAAGPATTQDIERRHARLALAGDPRHPRRPRLAWISATLPGSPALCGSAAKRNLHPSAPRGFFDRPVSRHVVILNPAASVSRLRCLKGRYR